ncbi:MAG: TonB-dependent receptor [Verrucomicrobiales bacterium]|nr:TonB-dependent receptor [Verrucomicrobiales bacterium]
MLPPVTMGRTVARYGSLARRSMALAVPLLRAGWCLLAWLSLAMPAVAQDTGTISGVIIEGWDGRPLGGVTITVRGTTLAGTSDAQGRFQLSGVPVGDQTVRFSRAGYAAAVVTEVRVLAGQSTTVNGTLRPEFFEMEEYEVTAEVFQEQAIAILQERQDSASILEAIGSDQFRKLGVSDAADIMTKVTGTTVVEGKFAVIRGLGDRYNITLLNGAEIPTADPYRRAAQLDMIPAGMIERMLVSKTFTPDLPGGFAGGAANIITRAFPDKFKLSVSLGTEYNTQATGNEKFLTYRGGATDWAAFDDGTRELPPALRAVSGADLTAPPRVTRETSQQAAERRVQADRVQGYLNSFGSTQFAPTTEAPPPNNTGSLSIGDTRKVGEGKLGYLAAVSYLRKFSFYDDGYSAKYRNAEIDPEPYESYVDARSLTEVNWSGVVNVGYQLNEDHEFGFNFIYNRNAEDMARRLTGTRPENIPGLVVDRSSLHWTERYLQNFQMLGRHEFPDWLEMRADWLVSLAGTGQDEPDQRFFNYARNADFTGNVVNNNALPEPSVPTRNFRNLEESNLSARFDDTVKFRLIDDLETVFGLGTSVSLSTRDFFQKSFAFETGTREDLDPWTAAGDPNSYLTSENLQYTTETNTRGATNYIFPRRFQTQQFGDYSYSGSQDLFAGYFRVEQALTPWLKVLGGLRPESTDLQLISLSNRGNTNAGIQRLDVLPSAGLLLNLTSNMNVRLSYSETVARPTYREFAPYEAYDPFGDEIVRGNPNLQMSDIRNYDARWEWFPAAGSILSVGGFYKELKKPIEKVIVTFGGGIVGFENREQATVYGAEFEARQKLDIVDDLLADFSVGFNFSYILSEVPLTAQEKINDPNSEDPRQLYDQSEWIINTDVSWDNPRWGTTATLAFNWAAPRIYLVDVGGPDVFEHPPMMIDLVVSQKLSKHWKLRVSGKNLVNAEFQRTYGDVADERVYSRNTRGVVFGLQATYEY